MCCKPTAGHGRRAITGASLAVSVACRRLVTEEKISESPIKKLVAAVSVGVIDGVALLDLNYEEDKAATSRSSICVATEDGSLVEAAGLGRGSDVLARSSSLKCCR